MMKDSLLMIPHSPRQEEILAMAETLAQRCAERATDHDRQGTLAYENYADIRELGYHTLPVPVKDGGMGATLFETVLAQERLARGDGATALTIDMHLHLISTEREMRTWPEQRFRQFCRQVIDQGALINSIASEPELGSPSRGGVPKTRARWDGTQWLMTGHKSWASGIEVLSHAVITAAIEASDRPSGAVGVFLVETGLPGMRVVETWDVMGMRATGSHDLLLEDVALPADALLMEREPGAKATSTPVATAWFALTICAIYLGIATAARDFAVQYAQDRRPTALGGKSIATLELVQRQFGELETQLLSSRALLYNLADSWDRAGERRVELMPAVGACKVNAVHQAIAATDAAMRVVGGSSMSRAFPLERYVRDVRAGLFHPPAADAGYIALGRALVESLAGGS